MFFPEACSSDDALMPLQGAGTKHLYEAPLEPAGGAMVLIMWRVLISGIALNAVCCHISPGLMVRLQSNPWTTQLSWLFGVKAQNFQTLNFVLYHQSLGGKVSHIPTIIAEFAAWTYVIHYAFGFVACLLMLCLVVGQAASSRYAALVCATSLACLLVMTASVCITSKSADLALLCYRAAQVTILVGGPVRVVGHLFEEKQPPMPASKKDAKWFRFKPAATLSVTKKAVITPLAIFAEASAGMPLRLFVPLVNAFIGQYVDTASDSRPAGLESIGSLVHTCQDVLKNGWKATCPITTGLLKHATKLESAPKIIPDVFLTTFWHGFFTAEGVLLFAASFIWFAFPNVLLTVLGWSLNLHDRGTASAHLPVTSTTFAFSMAASVMICGFVWVLMRMLSSQNLDIRSFCYVVEGLTLCLVLQIGFAVDLQLSGVDPGDMKNGSWARPNFIAIYSMSSIVLTICAMHCFFLAVEVPRMRCEPGTIFGESSCSGWSSDCSTPVRFRKAKRRSLSESSALGLQQSTRRMGKVTEEQAVPVAADNEPPSSDGQVHDDVFGTPSAEHGALAHPGSRKKMNVLSESDNECEHERPAAQNERNADGIRKCFTRFRGKSDSSPLGSPQSPGLSCRAAEMSGGDGLANGIETPAAYITVSPCY